MPTCVAVYTRTAVFSVVNTASAATGERNAQIVVRQIEHTSANETSEYVGVSLALRSKSSLLKIL